LRALTLEQQAENVMKTWVPKGKDLTEQDRKWYVVDADGAHLGRLCTRVSNILTGKNKPTYTPHADMGDHVIVINAGKVRLTGKKLSDKLYYSHSGYPGGIRSETAGEKLKRSPEKLIRDAVKGMLPKTRLGRQMIGKLKVYTGEDHPHQAQTPEAVKLSELR
jgi:large subunit ribosomal protein L13